MSCMVSIFPGLKSFRKTGREKEPEFPGFPGIPPHFPFKSPISGDFQNELVRTLRTVTTTKMANLDVEWLPAVLFAQLYPSNHSETLEY